MPQGHGSATYMSPLGLWVSGSAEVSVAGKVAQWQYTLKLWMPTASKLPSSSGGLSEKEVAISSHAAMQWYTQLS